MNVHRRAKTTPASRALLVRRVVEQGWTMRSATDALGISERSGYKWLRRFREGGWAALEDRSSAPRRRPRRLGLQIEEWVVELRRKHRLSAVALAEVARVPRSTLGRLLRRHRLSRARDLEPRTEPVRYERATPGELIHLDVKKLGRIDGVGHPYPRRPPGPKERHRLGVCSRGD